MQLFLLIGFIITIIAVIFAVQNAFPVTVTFFIWQFEGSLALVLLLTFVLGFITSLLTSAPNAIKRSLTTASLRKELEKLKKELEEKDRTTPEKLKE